ncbi:OmpA family protein [Kaarinaea lacus]
MDPSTSGLFVTKKATKERVAIGEFVEYKLSVANVSAGGLTNTVLTDVLPPGFRLERGSVTIDGVASAAPAIAADGRTLSFNLGNLAASTTVNINYVTAVSVGAETGNAVNSAYANAFGGIGSNTANASVLVEDDLMHSRSFVMGRVMAGSCKAASTDPGTVSLQLQSESIADRIHFHATGKIEIVPVKDFEIIVNLPEVLKYLPDSTTLGGTSIANPAISGKQLIFNLGDLQPGTNIDLKFATNSIHDMYGEFSATANAQFKIDSSTISALNKETTLITPVLENRFKDFPRSYRTRFETLSAELTTTDKENLKDLAHILRDQSIKQVTIVGHADKRRIRKSAKSKYKNNQELSLARAESVASYIQQVFKLKAGQISTIASGVSKPIYYSSRLQGRELSKEDQLSVNRRVEVFIQLSDQLADTRFIMTKHDSGLSMITTQGPSGEMSGPDLGEGAEGIRNVRLYLEDGRFVDTDDNGLYHFEGLRPGTHVVQVDESSLPKHLELYQCENNTRFAGSPNSRFVDIQPGGLWRADFYVRNKPMNADKGKIGIQLRSKMQNGTVTYTVDISGSANASTDRKLVVNFPDGLEFVEGSATVDGNKPGNVNNEQQKLIIDIGSWRAEDWHTSLSFSAKSSIRIEGEYTTTAQLQFRTSDNDIQQSSRVFNTLLHQAKTIERPIFEATYQNKQQIEINSTDRTDLDSVIDYLLDKRVRKLRIVSHTDNKPVPPDLVHVYKDNHALSLERATKVGAYIARKLSLYSNQIELVDKGADEPRSSNETETGRQDNRRLEIFVTYGNSNGEKETVINQNDSGLVNSTVTSQFAINNEVTKQAPGSIDRLEEGILSLNNGDITSEPNQFIKIQLNKNLKPVLSIDGEKVSDERIGFRAERKSTDIKIYSYIGVNLGPPGEHVISLQGIGPFGNVRFNQDIHVTLVGDIANIRVLDTTGNVADGRTPVKARIQLVDSRGQTVPAGVELELKGGTLRPNNEYNPIPELRTRNIVKVSKDGYIEFAPVSSSGTYRAELSYGNTTFELETFVKANYREWIMVGLAEGTVGYNNVSGNQENLDSADIKDEYYSDGRLSFYAKGKIKGKYLLTSAYDSDKEKVKVSGNGLFGEIQPDKYYTLYGDRTQSGQDAASTSKLYVKLESNEFYALYGDYNTDLSVTKLSNYNRSFTGLKSEYHNGSLKINAFATETNQAFVKDEISGDGTSGLYYLSNKNIVLNSEKVRIETRDRFRSEVIIASRQLSRFTDYTFDSVSGTIYFREPVYSRDSNFNPVYIIVDYEVEGDIDNNITAGGRIAYKPSKTGPEIGATVISEGTTGAEGELIGLDASYALSSKSQLKVEVATTESTSGNQTIKGDAYLAEINHQAGNLDSKVYYKEQEAGFGLGQQNGSESGTRKYGADVRSRLRENMVLNAEYMHQDNTSTNAKRDVIDSTVEVRKKTYSVKGGVLIARDEYGNGEAKDSNLIKGSVNKDFMGGRLIGNAAAEIGVDNDSADYPDRLLLGADYLLTQNTQLFAQQELSFGENQDTQMTRAGLKSAPWKNAKLHTSVENQSTENRERTFSNMGLTQGVEINKNWRMDFGVERAQTISESNTVPLNVNVPPSSGSISDDFTALSAGATYKNEKWSMTGRAETRFGDLEDKLGLLLGVYHEPEPGFGLASKLQFFDTDRSNGSSQQQTTFEFSIARRPIASQWILLDKIRFQHDKTSGTDQVTTAKLINNLSVNYLHDRSNQVSVNHGIKYVKDKLSGNTYSGITQILGAEYRHDFNAVWDVGVQASVLHSEVGSNQKYSFGASVGHSFARNVWLSVGFNFDGFTDSDFSGAKYTAEGVYVKFRFAFDHYTSRKVMAWWENRGD